MSPGRLLQYFEQISETPDAVSRLRLFILDLAVRGRLVEQDPADEPTSDLLKRIEMARNRMIVEGAVRAPKVISPVQEAEAPFLVPPVWRFVRIETVAYVEMGQSPSSDFYNQNQEGLPFFQGKADFGKRHPTPRYWCTAPTKLAEQGDILISVRAPVGPTNVATETCCIGRGLAALRGHPGCEREFLLLCLKKFEPDLEALGAGSTFVAINRHHLASFPIPLPPLAEQHRIVAKVDELMALCDELETARAKRERRRDRLVAATLHGLNNGDASAEPAARSTFEDSARFYFNHLPRLTARPEHIHQLRQTILNLAVRGRLVEQDPKEEGASDLFERIQQERQRLVRTSEIRRQQPMLSIGAEENPYIVPARWKWVRLGDLAAEITSGSRGWAEYYSSTGAKFIRAQNIRFGYLELSAIACVELPAPVEGKRTSARKDDLMIVITGAGVTNPGMLDQDIGEAYVSQHVGLVSPVERATSRWLLTCLMATTACRGELLEKAYGAGRPGLNLDTIRMLRVPLPPLAEQHRIVAKVDELMALCDELESRLTTTAITRRQLLESTLHEALEGGKDSQWEYQHAG